MPKIGDVSNDWMLIARRPIENRHYKYKWECQGCGDTIEKQSGAPPLHQCHRRFAPQTEEDKELVNQWYQTGFDLVETAIRVHHDYEYCRIHLLACEIAPWPRVSPDIHHAVDGEVDEDG